MDREFHILGISGSIRRASYNTMLLKEAALHLPADMHFVQADISNIPLFNQELETDHPAPVKEFAELCRTADGVLLATPEYNWQIPGVLKNALDWVSRASIHVPLWGKPVAVMGATPGAYGTARAQIILRGLLFALNMDPVNKPEVLLAGADQKFSAEGKLTDEDAAVLLRKLMEGFAKKVRARAEAK